MADIVLTAMLENFGNPNSLEHYYGRKAFEAIKIAKTEIALLVNADPEGVAFFPSVTSAVVGAIDLTLKGKRVRSGGYRIASSTVEHRAVLTHLEKLESQGIAELVWLKVNHLGAVSLDDVKLAADDVDLMCVMAANNEVGTVNPIDEIVKAASGKSTTLLVDASQAAGFMPLNIGDLGDTILILSSHKMYGPKGVAAIVFNPALRVAAGSEPSDSATPNVPAIVGFGEASRLRRIEMNADVLRIGCLRDRLQVALMTAVPEIVINGDVRSRLCTNLHLSHPNVPSDAVLANIDGLVAISTGAACSYGAETPSHVLRAMNMPQNLIEGALRISLGIFTQEAEVDLAADVIAAALRAVKGAVMA